MSRLSRPAALPTSARSSSGDCADYIEAERNERARRQEIADSLAEMTARDEQRRREERAELIAEAIRLNPTFARRMGWTK